MRSEAGEVVDSLSSAVHGGEHTLGVVPKLLKRVLKEKLWCEFVTVRGELVKYERFDQFVTTPPTKGLGATVDIIRRLVNDDREAVDLLDQELQRPGHRPKTTVNNVNGSEDRPVGNSSDAALRRLRKDRPDLHEKVIADELSPHAAMVQAGFRPKTVSVRPDDAESTARTLARHMSTETRARLKELL